MADITAAVRVGTPILTDGAIETRIMFEQSAVTMDPELGSASLLLDPQGIEALRALYTTYGRDAAGHPCVLGTPTFRASADWRTRSAVDAPPVAELNQLAVDMHHEIRDAAAGTVWIAGVLGPRGDAYTPDDAPSTAEAEHYHAEQADALARAGVDYLFAATLPAVPEAIGVARAMEGTGMPAVISFVLDIDGVVLDGTPLADAIDRIDAETAPAWFSLSCIHPDVAHRALVAAGSAARRVREVKANASRLTTTELVTLGHVDSGNVLT